MTTERETHCHTCHLPVEDCPHNGDCGEVKSAYADKRRQQHQEEDI